MVRHARDEVLLPQMTGLIAAMILLFAALMIVVMPAVQLQAASQAPEALEPYSPKAARGRRVHCGGGGLHR